MENVTYAKRVFVAGPLVFATVYRYTGEYQQEVAENAFRHGWWRRAGSALKKANEWADEMIEVLKEFEVRQP